MKPPRSPWSDGDRCPPRQARRLPGAVQDWSPNFATPPASPAMLLGRPPGTLNTMSAAAKVGDSAGPAGLSLASDDHTGFLPGIFVDCGAAHGTMGGIHGGLELANLVGARAPAHHKWQALTGETGKPSQAGQAPARRERLSSRGLASPGHKITNDCCFFIRPARDMWCSNPGLATYGASQKGRNYPSV